MLTSNSTTNNRIFCCENIYLKITNYKIQITLKKNVCQVIISVSKQHIFN
jgi:hypothetical protein